MPVQTRRTAHQQQHGDSTAHQQYLPLSVQLNIIDRLVAAYPNPDSDYTALWPYKSSLGWLLSLQRVCTCWNKHLQQQPVLLRRIRLERLHNLSLLHDYAYYITSSSKSKQQRIKQVPRSIELRFAGGSCTTFAVPRGGVAGAAKCKRPHAQAGPASTAGNFAGLPTHALLLVCGSHHITASALLDLLADLDTLDKEHAAPILLQVQDSSSCTLHHQQLGCGPSDEGSGGTQGSHFAALDAAVLPELSGRLRDMAKEGDAASGALTFIPTKQGFCRRVLLPAK